MNEKIKLLAEQAGMTDGKFGMFFAKDFDSHCADGVDLEKFAELIIQECCHQVREIDAMEITKHLGLKQE